MLKAVLLAKSLFGYASTRQLEDLCKNDIRFMFVMAGETPSHQSFQRFLHDDLKLPIDSIFIELNNYLERHAFINTDILYIDGTKYEANANKLA